MALGSCLGLDGSLCVFSSEDGDGRLVVGSEKEDGDLSILSSPIPLHKSDVQMQALIVSDSTEAGLHSSSGSTGSSIFPRRILIGKHSLITDMSLSDFFQE